MPLAGRPSGARKPLRPGVTQSHRGRVVRNYAVLGLGLAFSFMIFSNSLNPEEETTAADPQGVEFQMAAASDNEPKVEAAPADPFEVLRVATLPGGFNGSPAYNNLLASAETAAIQISTYSSKQTPEAYVNSIQSLDNTFKAELLTSSTAMWQDIVKASITVKAEAAGIKPIIREYNEDSSLATVEAVVKKTVSYPDGTSLTQTGAYNITMVGLEQPDENVTWIVGGFEKR